VCKARIGYIGSLIGIVCALAGMTLTASAAPHSPPHRPNILFFVLDDVGIDQMKVFGYGGVTAPRTPNIDAIANAGVGFRNFWTMPECSPSRAMMFEGRYPFRTNVYDAILSVDLANSQVSPYETTIPKVLKRRGYESGLFGKFHMGLQGNNPFRYSMPASLGWDYFSGWLDETGDPSSIDRTAGGVAANGKSYSCGFVPSVADGGADAGACYAAIDGCEQLTTIAGIPPGRTCRRLSRLSGGAPFAAARRARPRP